MCIKRLRSSVSNTFASLTPQPPKANATATKMTGVTFVTNPICPFAHRVWLTLEEVGIPYEKKEASLTDKPAWFTEIYRKALGSDPTSDGKVPVLQDGDFVLTESAVVAEYVADKYGKSSNLLGKTAEDRARIQLFLEQVISKFVPAWYGLLRAQDDETKDKANKELLGAVARISKEFERAGGPFFLGSELSLGDILVFPWIYRFPVLAHYRNFSVPNTPEYAAFHRFVEAYNARKTLASASPDMKYIIEAYHKYAFPGK